MHTDATHRNGVGKGSVYGVERYTAIMFDGEVVIYGVTDIREALHRYQQWREGGFYRDTGDRRQDHSG
ncbi:MAG: hypothetical protein COC05_02485 [Gammaproteobacteria bacterium]|nr:MAG: hypothetical protein COC05_02485 [Gammaproteobacteria bacterium]